MAQQTNAWKHLRRVTLDNGMVVLAKLDRETGEETAVGYANETEANEICDNLRTAGVACHVGDLGWVLERLEEVREFADRTQRTTKRS